MRLSTVGIGKKDHSKQSDTQVALRRTLQIGHRSGNALKKIAGPSFRVHTVLWSYGSHLNNNCNISIGAPTLMLKFKMPSFVVCPVVSIVSFNMSSSLSKLTYSTKVIST